MRIAPIPVVILTLVGCGREAARPLPTSTAPDPPSPALPHALTFVWVVVLDGGGSGLCIPGATVEVVRGQGLGRRLTHSTLGCSYWYPDCHATFDGLNQGDELTLRASALGYAAKETTVIPTPGGQTAVSIVLSKTQ